MRHGLKALAIAALNLSVSPSICAGMIVPLDTFPSSGTPDGPDAGIYARYYDAQEIGLQFTLAAPGRITEIATGFSIGSGLCGWRLGIMSADFLGSTRQPGFQDNLWEYGVNLSWGNYQDPYLHCGGTDRFIESADPITLEGLDWFLDAGDYLLLAAWRSDDESAHWATNANLLSDQWVMQAIGHVDAGNYPCGGTQGEVPWVTLAQCGIDPLPTPTARITFAPGIRVPEPSTIALFGLGLLGIGFSSRRKLN